MGNYFDIKAIQEALTKEDVIKIVADLGSPDHKVGGSGELIFRSICAGARGLSLYREGAAGSDRSLRTRRPRSSHGHQSAFSQCTCRSR